MHFKPPIRLNPRATSASLSRVILLFVSLNAKVMCQLGSRPISQSQSSSQAGVHLQSHPLLLRRTATLRSADCDGVVPATDQHESCGGAAKGEQEAGGGDSKRCDSIHHHPPHNKQTLSQQEFA
ncbi:hypothetical protein F7725_007018 [Dissostichus mawsoni]|uniref:Uncharacterized protein n=1 Tax=Dissostichus mawsoni TaxID=36200 RepID=A0A7J5XVL0_DISMA|nr:hypothetical protein F7725_007018 [Dissostichus mawsoni]